MFISNTDKARIEKNLKYLIEEVATLRIKMNNLEGWETVKVNDKPLYKWMNTSGTFNVPKGEATVSITTLKKRGRPLGSKNTPKKAVKK